MKLATLLVPIVALAAGCAGGYVGYTEPSGAYVDEAPPVGVDVETYPRAYYGGDWVYNVNGRYYRRHGNGWYRYREEPRGLQFRTYRREDRDEHFEHHHDHDRDHDHHD